LKFSSSSQENFFDARENLCDGVGGGRGRGVHMHAYDMQAGYGAE
jgi:hypothetical protein